MGKYSYVRLYVRPLRLGDSDKKALDLEFAVCHLLYIFCEKPVCCSGSSLG
jgi:hypothetical protein